MPRPTLAQYLKFLGEKPQTKDWGAILVYDRFKTNMLLTQEHIERFDGSHWLKPINLRDLTETGSYIDLAELTFSKPSLTFVNSSISSSDARLSMRMVGGTIKHLREKSGSDTLEVVSIARVDPLTAPSVRMNISLKESNGGNINDKGRVTLNLAEGTAYTFEVSAWKDLNDKVGSAIRKEFQGREVEEQVWELNTLAPVEGELKPTSFSVRTHSLAKAGQALASTDPAELEEGAVLVGVAFHGEAVGDWPAGDEGFPYLLPLPAPGSEHDSYTLNLIISNDSWVKHVLSKAWRSVPEITDPEPVFVQEGAFCVGIDFSSTVNFSYPGDREDFDEDSWVRWQRYDAFALTENDKSLRFRLVANNKIIFQWAPVADVTFEAYFLWTEVWWTAERRARYKLLCTKEFDIDLANDGRVIFKAGSETSKVVDIENLDGYNWGIGPFEKYIIQDTAPVVLESVVASFKTIWTAVNNASVSLDVLRLNGLLFRSNQVAEPQLVRTPGDLSLLGTLAPKFTAFAIEPLEASIGAGTSQDFALTTPPNGPVTWTVKPVPGSEGEIGSIKDGTYTAPTRDKITGASKQVIVEAQSGDSISRALVTVVARKVSAYPLLQVAHYSPEPPTKPRTYLLIGGSLDEQLQWSMGGGAKGALREPNADDDNLEIPPGANARIYEAPTHQPGAANTIGRVLQLDTVRVSAGGETDVFDILIAWFPVTGVLKATQPEEGKLALELWTPGGMMDPELIPPDAVDWYTVRGAGNIDEKTGVYTINEKDSDYVILAAIEKTRPNTWDYVVLPLPYDPDYIEKLKQVKQNTGAKGA